MTVRGSLTTPGSSLVDEPFEEGEPERITEPDEPLSPETIRALKEYGVEFPLWKPEVDRG